MVTLRKLVLALLLAALPATAAAGSALEAQVAQATWNRNISVTLQSIAAVRVIEIQTTFAHRPMPELAGWNWGEVIAYNAGYADPIAQVVIQWRNSPAHWAVLTDGYTDIGCAAAPSGTRWYFVCLLGNPPAGPGSVPGPGPAPQPIVDVLPDTAMENPMNPTVIRFIEAFVAVFVVAFAADPIFNGESVNLFGEGGLQALVTAAVAAALLAVRRVLATQT